MYRTIDTTLWTDPKVQSLPSDAKLLFLYCITNTHAHVGGIYYLPSLYASHETGIPADRIDTLWDTLSGAGLARRDSEKHIIWIINMLRYQGKGEKIERAVANHLGTLHNSFLIKDFLSVYREVKRFYKDRVSKGHPAQDEVGIQEQEQEQEQEQNTPLTPLPKKRGRPPAELPAVPEALDTPDFREAWAEWIAYRAERKPKVTPRAASGAFARMMPWGPERAIQAIRESIAQSWQGIFEPRSPPKPSANGDYQQRLDTAFEDH